MDERPRFHIAFPVDDLAAARHFYSEVLGCPEGRSDDWRRLAHRLVAVDTEFVIEPHVRFVGQPGEQSTMFLLDPAGNALEFKAFADDSMIFAK